MTEFGVATIVGSVVFATCFIPAVAHLANYGLSSAKAEPTELERRQNKRLLGIFLRDMAFTLVGLTLLYHFLSVGSITHHNLAIFLVMFIVYGFMLVQQTQGEINDEPAIRKKNEEMSAEDLSLQ